MSYVQKTTTYGPFIEIVKHHTSMYGRHEARKKRSVPTSEEVEQNNRRHTVDKLYKKLVNNFEPVKDSYVTLTLKPEFRKDPETVHQLFTRKFIPAMRKAYRKEGIEFKYVFVAGGYPDAMHFHVVINSYAGKSMNEILTRFWPYGSIKSVEPLYPDYDWAGLADYMVANSYDTFRDPDNPFRQIFSCSRNLENPKVERKIIKAGEWRKTPKVPPKMTAAGYDMVPDSLVIGTDIYGFAFQKFILVKKRHAKKC